MDSDFHVGILIQNFPGQIAMAVMGVCSRLTAHSSLLVGLLFSAIDSSIVSTALITISDDLEDFTHASWVVLSYMLAYLGQ